MYFLDAVSDRMIGVAGTALGVLGIVLSVYYYHKGRAVAVPRYYLTDRFLLSPRGTNFEISYSSTPVVESVRRVTLAIWNGGSRIIERTDIASADKLRLVLPERSRVLEIEAAEVSRPAINFQVNEDKDGLLIDFDFLDPGDGAMFHVIYERPDPSEGASLAGTIKGSPGGFASARGIHIPKWAKRAWMLSFLIILASTILSVNWAEQWMNFKAELAPPPLTGSTIAVATAVALAGLVLILTSVRDKTPSFIFSQMRGSR